jgi:Na+-transporting NADH:ubiquinone oxidoreductase subunit C
LLFKVTLKEGRSDMAINSLAGTLGVATVICVFCSILVSSSSVVLKPLQTENKSLDIKKNLLISAGLIKENETGKEKIREAFKKVVPYIVNLESGELMKDLSAENFDLKREAKDQATNLLIPPTKDIAKIKYRGKNSIVYFVKKNEQVDMIVLPVYGKGLWSTMYGFLTLGPDTKTVNGFGFYEHGETPGLGGEVDNPNWKKIWKGKILFDDNFEPVIKLIKGAVDPNAKDANNMVDGLAGATITTRGVEALLRYWLDDHGYGPFLEKFRKGEIQI